LNALMEQLQAAEKRRAGTQAGTMPGQ